MDPYTVAMIAQSALRLLMDDEADFRKRVEEALRDLKAEVEGLVLAPFDEGIHLLQQASVAEGDRRMRLVEAAQSKFSDAAARSGTPEKARGWSRLLSGLCWLALNERKLALADLASARRHADETLETQRRLAFGTPYGSEGDPMWKRLDEAAAFTALVHRLEAAAVSEAVLPLAELTAEPALGLPPAPGRNDCAFIGGYGPSKLGSVWHRLREHLGDDPSAQWFTEATDLRLLATERHLIVYSPNEIEQDGSIRLRAPLSPDPPSR